VFTSLHHFRSDLTAHPPDHFVCVPLVLDTLYSKVRPGLDGAQDAVGSHES
jgi:long-chain acyl-CoA synthetase